MPKILVIDDSEVMHRYLRKHLEAVGFEVESWVDPTVGALEARVTSSMPDLILSDYMMPGCDGGTIARMVRRTHPDIPVLVLTAFRDDQLEAKLFKLGAKRVLTKPIGPEDLVKALNEALQEKTI